MLLRNGVCLFVLSSAIVGYKQHETLVCFETLPKDRDCYCLVNQSCCGDPGSGGSESSCQRPEICGHYAG